MTLDQVKSLLLRRAKTFAAYKNSTGVKGWCGAHGVKSHHAYDFLSGKRAPPPDLLAALGLEWRLARKRKATP